MKPRWIDAVLDGTATQAQRRAVEDAAREDPEVRQALAQGSALLRALEDMDTPEPTEDLVAAAERRYRREQSGRGPVLTTRRIAWAGAGAAFASLALTLGSLTIDETPPSTAAAPVLPQVEPVVVTSVDGEAWVDSNGRTRRAAIGDVINDGGRLRTGSDARMTVRLASSAAVTLEPGSELGVVSSAAVIHERGAVSLSGDLELRVRGTLHRLELHAAEARSLRRGDSRATIATLAGEVRLSDSTVLPAGSEVDLSAERHGVIRPSRDKLALDAKADGKRDLVVRGQTNPGAMVNINGERVVVNEDGAFEHKLTLDEGEAIVIEATDVLGRERQLALNTPRPARQKPAPEIPPNRKIETDWEWEALPDDGSEEPG